MLPGLGAFLGVGNPQILEAEEVMLYCRARRACGSCVSMQSTSGYHPRVISTAAFQDARIRGGPTLLHPLLLGVEGHSILQCPHCNRINIFC